MRGIAFEIRERADVVQVDPAGDRIRQIQCGGMGLPDHLGTEVHADIAHQAG